MDEANKRRWDVGLGIAGPILTVAGILTGVWQFNVGEERKAAYEHASKLWLQRVETYTAVAKVAGRIAAPADADAFKKAVAEFMSAYWGDMILFEDGAAEKAMVDFRVEVQDYTNGRSDADSLKVRADMLMNALKASLAAKAPQP